MVWHWGPAMNTTKRDPTFPTTLSFLTWHLDCPDPGLYVNKYSVDASETDTATLEEDRFQAFSSLTSSQLFPTTADCHSPHTRLVARHSPLTLSQHV